MKSPEIETIFPGLVGTSYEVTSPKTSDYNCIAHAAEDDQNFWWPSMDYYWPEGMPLNDSVSNFIQTFNEIFGYEVCSDGNLEPGYQKVVIYADGTHTKHMARQLSNGDWTSKLGSHHDISHPLKGVEGNCYGQVSIFMKRKIEN